MDIKTQEVEKTCHLPDSEMLHNSSDIFLKLTTSSNNTMKHDIDSSDEDPGPVSRVKKRLQRFTDSESDTDKECDLQNKHSDSEGDTINKIPLTTRERRLSIDSSDSDGDNKSIKNAGQQLRMKNKRNKMRDKFKSLLTSRSKDVMKTNTDSENECQSNHSDESDQETSINNIKQEIKKSMPFKPSICDPDTSDEEEIDGKAEKLLLKSQNFRKTTKPTSPKPIRMTAKQAMENMQKIKSESNRLLREKEVTLPYHRPKAFSLKDIMSRRKPAVSADGKALPIKMNEQQLKHYVQMLEQRQKDIMDLCKSDSDEEQESSNDVDSQKEPSHDKHNSGDSIKNNENQTMVDEVTTCVQTLPQEDTQELYETSKSTDLDVYGDNTSELDNNPNTGLEKENSIEVDKVRVSTNNTENVNTDSLDKLKVVAKDSIIDEIVAENMDNTEKSPNEQIAKVSTEEESQIINLYYDSENTNNNKRVIIGNDTKDVDTDIPQNYANKPQGNDFSDDDIDMDDIDKLIENAEIINDVSCDENGKSSMLTTATQLFIKPKLTGAPGMVIDLDEDSSTAKKLSGVELLKERFTYFAKLKTPEELEREREKKCKPGAQHLKLKYELEEIIAEQRSMEWAKRLNEEKQQQEELKALRGEESDGEDDIDKIEAQIEEKDAEHETSEEGESEPEEDDLGEIKDKPRCKNPMFDDEAVESDCDDDIESKQNNVPKEDNEVNEEDNEDNDVSCEEQSSEESTDNESEEETTKPRKGRILKAFEDSDDETGNEVQKDTCGIESSPATVNGEKDRNDVNNKVTANILDGKDAVVNEMEVDSEVGSEIFKDSQDDEIQLAQRMVSVSDDLFTSQESASLVPGKTQGGVDGNVGTQTFSILNCTKDIVNLESTEELISIGDTSMLDSNLVAALPACSGSFTKNFIPSHLTSSQQQIDKSQPIGEDVLALCTGNFYDNEFISQSDENGVQEAVNDNFDDSWSKGESQEYVTDALIDSGDKQNSTKDNNSAKDNDMPNNNNESKFIDDPEHKDVNKAEGISADQNLLQSIIDELHDDKMDSLKSNKYFPSQNTDVEANNQVKKKFVIESDDELNEDTSKQKRKNKVKKKKLEQRALQISDDEQDESDDAEEYLSDIENGTERIVEYDSEENEIEMKEQNPKKKRKVVDFFENEAELTSEDEWVGSGDEDEAGLDRMEREEGDDDTFHQGKLQRELGQIHMRDVLDQDKREVRLIQELLFEDGDLGDGHRQRKFRWKNADGAEEPDTVVDDLADTQEDEFESEEQWRKQRHEREVFLRQMKEQDKNGDTPNVTLNRSTIIKANLSSKTMSSLLLEVNNTSIKTDKEKNPTVKEKAMKDIPSPKKGFTILQQNYHSSLLTRGRGALARLAALATPLALDDDSTKIAAVAPKNRRNFVFAAVTKDEDEPKVMKRKADSKVDTPRLVKKFKTNEKQTITRNSLLDHLRI